MVDGDVVVKLGVWDRVFIRVRVRVRATSSG